MDGKIWLGEINITLLPSYERVKACLAYFMQGGRVFPNLTVAENLDMGMVTINMEQVIAEYLAEKLISDIRSGVTLPGDLGWAVIRLPLRDYLRQRIKPKDFNALRSMCNSEDEELQNLGLVLLRNIKQETDVRKFLEEMWQRPGLPFSIRIGLQFQLIDYGDLDAGFHEEFLKFTLTNWEEWLDSMRAWCGGSQNAVNYCRARLEDKGVAPSRRWAFICAAAAANDSSEARSLIEVYANDSDLFLRGVANNVLSRLQ